MKKLLLCICAIVFAFFPVKFIGHAETLEQPSIESITFIDKDPAPGEISGNLTINVRGNDTEMLSGYEITLEDNQNKSQKIGSLKATGKNEYIFFIPENTDISQNTSRISVDMTYKPGVSSDWLGMTAGLLDNTSAVPPKNVDIEGDQIFVSYSEWEAGMNSSDLAPWIHVYTKDRITDWSFKDKYKEYAPEDIRMAVLYYLDAAGNKIEQIGQLFLEDGMNDIRLPKLTSANKPNNAAAIGVFAKSELGESKEYIAVGLLNFPISNIEETRFVDSDNETNKVSGTVTWKKPRSEKNIVSYGIYVTKNSGYEVVNKLGDVKPNNQDKYSFAIPKGTSINVTNGERLIVLPEFHGYYQSYNGIVNINDRNPETIKPRTLSLREIQVTQEGKSIGVTLETLKPQDIVKIYDKPTGGKLLRSVDAHSGWISFGFDLPSQLNQIYLSVTNVFGVEGKRTAIKLKAPKVTNSLSASQVKVFNTKKKDIINISKIKKDDVIKIYSSSKKLIKTVKANSSSISIPLDQLGKKAGFIWVSKTSDGLQESLKVKIAYSKEK
ncbi:hypothetical protein [Peribacillus sp. SCS-155]|uniref:hypothetical protein n=1 Tax=Peribacillus sedimenti TaxID=3115297 RepID=UPI0039058132